MKKANIFCDVLEASAKEQFESAMDQPYVVKGALMPDAHTGYALPIGAVVATEGVIVPSWIGYDIGCGVCAVPTTFKRNEVEERAKEIFEMIYKVVPVGFAHNQKDSVWYERYSHKLTDSAELIFSKNGLKQLCSLGGGNHFIEIGYDENDQVWIIIHSGSRGIGHSVATYYMRLASGDGKAREGHFGFNVDSKEGRDYITDMNFCLAFALENRMQIAERVSGIISLKVKGVVEFAMAKEGLVNRNHNHAELKDGLWIHRKGATHAEAGMKGVIPGNMRDGSFIVVGKGNPDSLYSSSHGAGRVLGRKAAQREVNVEDFAETMKGIVANVGTDTVDESPFAYKNIFDVMEQQKDMVEVLHHVRPIINVKG